MFGDLIERIALCGVTVADPSTIRNVELGHKRPSKDLLRAWANALGFKSPDVKLAVITDGEDEEPLPVTVPWAA